MESVRAKRLALQLAMEVAPTDMVQQAFTSMYHAADKDGTDPVLCILHTIMDGLEYGNWPE